MLGFGDKIKQLREAKGMTQQAMAEQLHVTRQTVSRWESGARLPDLHTAKKIAELLGVSIDELVAEEAEENVDNNFVETSFVGTVSLEKTPEQPKKKQEYKPKVAGNKTQIILYTVITSFLSLMTILQLYSYIDLYLNGFFQGVYGTLGIVELFDVGRWILTTVSVVIGLIWIIQKRLKTEMIGYLMALPFFLDTILWIGTQICWAVDENLTVVKLDRVTIDIMVPVLIIGCIIRFFKDKGSNYLYWGVCLIGILDSILIIYKNMQIPGIISRWTILLYIVHEIATTVLLLYHAYVVYRERRVVCNS